jgi:hypothetical protein
VRLLGEPSVAEQGRRDPFLAGTYDLAEPHVIS